MNNINPKIFKAYDIRGFYPQEINKNTAYVVGCSLVAFLQNKYQQKELSIVVGRDGRDSSPELSEEIKKGILSMGVNVIDIGLVPAPVFYFAVWNYGYDGGIYTTASHNPSEYNGFKLVERGAVLIAANTGIDKIRDLATNNDDNIDKNILIKGKTIPKDMLGDYENFVLKNFHLENFKSMKIAIDCANGAGSVLVPSIAAKIPGKHELIFCELDGRFPNHLPDPSQKTNLEQLSKVVIEKNCDLGVAFDGDGDRVGFIDEKGEMISPNLISALLSQIFLRDKNEKSIVYTVCMSNIISDIVSSLGGKLIMTKVGFTFVKEGAIQENAALGAEISGHYCLKSDNFCEGPIFVWLSILEQMSKTGKRASDLFAQFKKYYYEGPLNFEVKDKERALLALEEKYEGKIVNRLDGIRIDFDDWWFNVRPSNTENLLRIVIEAKSQDILEKRKKEILEIIESG